LRSPQAAETVWLQACLIIGLENILLTVSAQEIIDQIKALPPFERAKVARFVLEQDDSWIPEDFKDAMKDAEAGRLVDMEKALFETPPPNLQ